MRLDLWSDEHDSVRTNELAELTENYKSQVDRTAFKQLTSRLDEYGTPIHKTFPIGETMESFILLDSDLSVTVRIESEGGLVNMHMTTELPDDVTKSEAIVRALIAVGKDFDASRPEVSYLRNSQKASVQMLLRT